MTFSISSIEVYLGSSSIGFLRSITYFAFHMSYMIYTRMQVTMSDIRSLTMKF